MALGAYTDEDLERFKDIANAGVGARRPQQGQGLVRGVIGAIDQSLAAPARDIFGAVYNPMATILGKITGQRLPQYQYETPANILQAGGEVRGALGAVAGAMGGVPVRKPSPDPERAAITPKPLPAPGAQAIDGEQPTIWQGVIDRARAGDVITGTDLAASPFKGGVDTSRSAAIASRNLDEAISGWEDLIKSRRVSDEMSGGGLKQIALDNTKNRIHQIQQRLNKKDLTQSEREGFVTELTGLQRQLPGLRESLIGAADKDAGIGIEERKLGMEERKLLQSMGLTKAQIDKFGAETAKIKKGTELMGAGTPMSVIKEAIVQDAMGGKTLNLPLLEEIRRAQGLGAGEKKVTLGNFIARAKAQGSKMSDTELTKAWEEDYK